MGSCSYSVTVGKVCLKLEPGLRRGESRDRGQIQDQDTATLVVDFHVLWATNFPLGLISTGVKSLLLATKNGLTNTFPTVSSQHLAQLQCSHQVTVSCFQTDSLFPVLSHRKHSLNYLCASSMVKVPVFHTEV